MDKPEREDWIQNDAPGRVLSWAAGITFAFTLVCLLTGLKSNILELSHGSFSLLLKLALVGSTALFFISMAKLSLRIMYAVFGIMPFRVGPVLGWLIACVLSVIPLLLSYLLSTLAGGMRL